MSLKQFTYFRETVSIGPELIPTFPSPKRLEVVGPLEIFDLDWAFMDLFLVSKLTLKQNLITNISYRWI